MKEKARLEEALQSESGQQQLAIRTYRIQLSKQIDRINTLNSNVEQAKDKRETLKIAAQDVRRTNVVLLKHCLVSFRKDQRTIRKIEKRI